MAFNQDTAAVAVIFWKENKTPDQANKIRPGLNVDTRAWGSAVEARGEMELSLTCIYLKVSRNMP